MSSVEIHFEKIIHGGDAMGRLEDGRPVFVPFVAAGERARVELVEEKKGYLRAKLVEVLEPSPDRIAPRCRHFGECGGCQWQHLRYDAQLRAKEEILREQLIRLGGMTDPPLRGILSSPDEWNYRNHVQFSLGSKGALGFFRPASRSVIPVTECHLPEERLLDLWKNLDLEPFPDLRQVGFRAADDGEMIVFESETGELPEAEVEAEISAALTAPGGKVTYLAGGPLGYRIRERDFTVGAGSFFQINTGLIPAMVECVLDLAAPDPGDLVIDLYCGTGLFSAFLAGKAGGLIGVEESPSAVADFQSNLDDFDNVELYAAPAEIALENIARKVDIAVVDPPRGGKAQRAMRALLRLAPNRVVMVSCDPATLARDARSLAGAGYRMRSITPIDLFPQTWQVESASLWVKE